MPWHLYTHFRHGAPIIREDGSAYCNKSDVQFQQILNLAHHHNVSVQWAPGIPNMHAVLWDPNKAYLRTNYMKSIGNAVKDCNVDGIEVDYEFQDSKDMKLGIVSPAESTHYSQFLADIKSALGPDKLVSADVSIWGFAPGNYLFPQRYHRYSRVFKKLSLLAFSAVPSGLLRCLSNLSMLAHFGDFFGNQPHRWTRLLR